MKKISYSGYRFPPEVGSPSDLTVPQFSRP
jgi:hypothetical protein